MLTYCDTYVPSTDTLEKTLTSSETLLRTRKSVPVIRIRNRSNYMSLLHCTQSFVVA